MIRLAQGAHFGPGRDRGSGRGEDAVVLVNAADVFEADWKNILVSTNQLRYFIPSAFKAARIYRNLRVLDIR